MYTSKLFLVAAYPSHLLSFLMFQCITTTCHLSCMFLSLVGFQFFVILFFSFSSHLRAQWWQLYPQTRNPSPLKDKKIFYTYLCDVKKTVSSTSIARKYILIKKVSNLIKIIMKKRVLYLSIRCLCFGFYFGFSISCYCLYGYVICFVLFFFVESQCY